MDDHPSGATTRRHFLKGVASATTALPFVGVAAAGEAAAQTAPAAAPAAPANNAAPITGYASFSPDEAAFIEAMVNVMCPADQYTPNGVDCGLATYIDRQLAGDFGRGAKRYMRGPWGTGKPQQGWQHPMTPEQFFKAGLAAANDAAVKRFQRTFDRLKPEEANAFLVDLGGAKVEDPEIALGTWFNELVYPLFAQACFADPMYGGNHDKVFWKLIGYPGLPATHTIDIVKYRNQPYPGAKDPKSIVDFS